MAADKRFDLSLSESGLSTNYNIIVDKKTGVNYLWVRGTMSAGLTPLLNADGSIIVTKDTTDAKEA